MSTEEYNNELLKGWEEVYQKGQLTLWVLLALKEGPKHMAEISAFIHECTAGTFAVEDQSLYRALRRYADADMIDYRDVPGDKGPQRKEYVLTGIGKQLLQAFLERNIIAVYYTPRVQKLIR